MKLKLSDNEVLELKILHRAERDRKKCDRIKAILMFNKGYSAVEIGAVLLIDENTVSGWKDRYLNRKNTQEWLLTQCIGYQGKLSEDQETQVDKYVQKNLISDARQVQSFIKKEFQKTYTISGVIERLHRLGFNYKQTTLMPAKIDPEKQAQFKDAYDEFKKNLKEDEVLLFLDGVHPQHNTKCSRAWIKIGEQKQIKSNSGRRRLNISEAYDPISQDILVREDKTINAETVMAFFKQIEAAYPSKASIYVIADQALIIKTKTSKSILKRHVSSSSRCPPIPQISTSLSASGSSCEKKLSTTSTTKSLPILNAPFWLFSQTIPSNSRQSSACLNLGFILERVYTPVDVTSP